MILFICFQLQERLVEMPTGAESSAFHDIVGLVETVLVKEALSPHLRETAYALALDIALAEAPVAMEENRVLQRLKVELGIDRLVTAALERAALVRHYRVTA